MIIVTSSWHPLHHSPGRILSFTILIIINNIIVNIIIIIIIITIVITTIIIVIINLIMKTSLTLPLL